MSERIARCARRSDPHESVLTTVTPVVDRPVVRRCGQEVPVYVELTRVADGDDFVVALGVHLQEAADEVRPGVATPFEGTEH